MSTTPPPMALNRELRGKQGRLHLGFEVEHSSGRTILRTLDRRAPMVVQQALYWDEQLPTMACLYTLSSGGPLVDGDRYDTRIHLGPGAEVHLSNGAATRLASMEHDRVAIHQSLHLEPRSYLEWLPEPLIPSAHSRCDITTEVVVAPDAALFWGEVVCCGRLHHGERFAFDHLSQNTTLLTTSGVIIAREMTRLTPSQEPFAIGGTLGHFTHWGTIFALAPTTHSLWLESHISAHYSSEKAIGVALLRGDRGIVVRLLGHSAEQLKAAIRTLCSLFRERIKGLPLEGDFPWR